MATAMNRLLWWHWLLIGFGASLVLFLILYFAMIRPATIKTTETNADSQSKEDAGGTPDKIAQKKAELKKEQANTKKVDADWETYASYYMPDIRYNKDVLRAYEGTQGTGTLLVNGKEKGVKDLPEEWGKWISKWYSAQGPKIEKGGLKPGIIPLTGFPIEAFSPDPNDVSKLTAIAFPQTKPWAVEVSATNFDAAMNHLERFNHIRQHGMPIVDNVALAGQSPDLRVRYDLKFVVIPPVAPPPSDPKIDATGAPAGGGGGGGGASPIGGGGGGRAGRQPVM
ncbi:MAG TPA: hypothetical protein VKT77_04465 [Chthonomonadaceae bacterium]|nr:hypothetical protein [Chthonomonadaceae bacterium]